MAEVDARLARASRMAGWALLLGACAFPFLGLVLAGVTAAVNRSDDLEAHAVWVSLTALGVELLLASLAAVLAVRARRDAGAPVRGTWLGHRTAAALTLALLGLLIPGGWMGLNTRAALVAARIRALRNMKGRSDAEVGELVKYPHHVVCLAAISALRKRRAIGQLDALVWASQHADPWNRRRALYTIQGFGPAAAAAIPALLPRLREPEPGREVVDALAAIGPRDPRVLEALARRMDHRSVRNHAANALFRARAAAIGPLVTVIESAPAAVRREAVETLQMIGKVLRDPDGRAFTELARLMANPDPELRIDVITHVHQVHGFERIKQALQARLDDPHPRVRWVAAAVTTPWTGPREPWFGSDRIVWAAREDLLAVAGLRGHALQSLACRTLQLLAVAAPASERAALVQSLAKLCGAASWRTRAGAAAALRLLHGENVAALEALMSLLEAGPAVQKPNQNPEWRAADSAQCNAIWSIGEMGPAARSAVPRLRALRVDGDGWMPRYVKVAIDKLEGRVPPDASPGG